MKKQIISILSVAIVSLSTAKAQGGTSLVLLHGAYSSIGSSFGTLLPDCQGQDR